MELAELRKQIDKIDRNLVELLNQRAKIALQIGEFKKDSGHTIQDIEREKSVIDAVISSNNGPLPANIILEIFTQIVKTCRELQQNNVTQTITQDK